MFSDSDEIRDVFEEEIAKKTDLVKKKRGTRPFFENFSGMRVFRIIDCDPSDTNCKE